MGKLDLLEENSQLIFHSLEIHDFTFLVSSGVIPLLQFIRKVESTKYLFVSDDLSIATRFKDLPYQSSIYDSRFSTTGSSWLTYDLCIFLTTEDDKFLESFDFVILDGVDSRELNSDYFLSLITNLSMKGRFIIPTRSEFKLEVYTKYIEKFGYSSNILKLHEETSRNIYTLPVDPTNLFKEIIDTVNNILDTDKRTDQYDVLVLLSSRSEIQSFKTQLLDADIKHDYSILADISTYKAIGAAHRRIILASGSKFFSDVDHTIRYIIDSGIVDVEKFDESGIEFFQKKRTNRNQISQNISILQIADSSYFGMFNDENLVDFEYGISRCFVVHLLYLLKIGFSFARFEFLKSPGETILRNAITLSIYLGLVIIEDDSVRLTDLGWKVLKFQVELNIPSLSLFTALSASEKFKCTKELLKISSVLLSVNINTFAKDLKHSWGSHKTLAVSQSDFLTVLNVFDSIIENEQHIKHNNNNNNYRDIISNKESKRQILYCYKQLRNSLKCPIDFAKASQDDIHKCLLSGFQLHVCTILKNVSNQGSMQLTVQPVIKRLEYFEIETKHIKLLVKDGYDKFETEYENGDIIIYHSCKYKLFYFQIIAESCFALLCSLMISGTYGIHKLLTNCII